MSNQHKHDEHHHHHHAEHRPPKKIHHQWWFWVAIVLMLGAMLIYVTSIDEALGPNDNVGETVPAAE
jgi:hypothetical protein